MSENSEPAFSERALSLWRLRTTTIHEQVAFPPENQHHNLHLGGYWVLSPAVIHRQTGAVDFFLKKNIKKCGCIWIITIKNSIWPPSRLSNSVISSFHYTPSFHSLLSYGRVYVPRVASWVTPRNSSQGLGNKKVSKQSPRVTGSCVWGTECVEAPLLISVSFLFTFTLTHTHTHAHAHTLPLSFNNELPVECTVHIMWENFIPSCQWLVSAVIVGPGVEKKRNQQPTVLYWIKKGYFQNTSVSDWHLFLILLRLLHFSRGEG